MDTEIRMDIEGMTEEEAGLERTLAAFRELSDSPSQKEKFRLAANRLLNQCFLLKRKEDTKKDYIFVRQNRELFEPYFELLGYELRINEDQGVIALTSDYATGRLELSKYESILLLILRLLYIEKRREISAVSEDVIVLMEEIREKYAMLKLRVKPVMDKSMERGMVSLFRRYNLIRNLDTDISRQESRILIYPSILMAVPTEEINAWYEMTEKKLEEYAHEKTESIGEQEE